jgi:hypothetical protein
VQEIDPVPCHGHPQRVAKAAAKIQAQHRGRVARRAPPVALAGEGSVLAEVVEMRRHMGQMEAEQRARTDSLVARMGSMEAEFSRTSANIEALLALARRP